MKPETDTTKLEEIGFSLYRQLKEIGVTIGGPENALKVSKAIEQAVDAAYQHGIKNAPLPASIQEALNSGDGVYRP